MTFEGLAVHRVRLPMRRPVGTAAGAHLERPVVYVELRADSGVGWGECAALADGTAVDPPLERLWRDLTGAAAGRLAAAAAARGGRLPPSAQVRSLFDADPAGQLAAAAIEMALLDLELRAAGRSLVEHLGGVDGAGVPVGGVVGIPPGRRVGDVVAAVDRLVEAGCRRVRVKIEPGFDVAPLAAVRRDHPDLALQADANGAYRWGAPGPEDARRLVGLDPLGLACLEQPLPAPDLPSHAELAAVLDTPVCLDESLGSHRRLVDALRYGACEVACLKPARLGGVQAARQAQALCQAAGVPAFVGGFFETGLARAANAAVATLPGFTMAGDLGAPAEYLEVDPCPYPEVRAGRLHLPATPGVGGRPDPAVLERFGLATVWIPAEG
ncbi:MAG: enolase C-terminal domain-like protein [Acidimicrobiales bacterium]